MEWIVDPLKGFNEISPTRHDDCKAFCNCHNALTCIPVVVEPPD